MTNDKCPVCGYKMTSNDGNICPDCLYSIGENPTTDNLQTVKQEFSQNISQQNHQQTPQQFQQQNYHIPQHDAKNAPGRQRRIILIVILIIFAVIWNVIAFIISFKAEMLEYENTNDYYYEYQENEQGVVTDC